MARTHRRQHDLCQHQQRCICTRSRQTTQQVQERAQTTNAQAVAVSMHTKQHTPRTERNHTTHTQTAWIPTPSHYQEGKCRKCSCSCNSFTASAAGTSETFCNPHCCQPHERRSKPTYWQVCSAASTYSRWTARPKHGSTHSKDTTAGFMQPALFRLPTLLLLQDSWAWYGAVLTAHRPAPFHSNTWSSSRTHDYETVNAPLLVTHAVCISNNTRSHSSTDARSTKAGTETDQGACMCVHVLHLPLLAGNP